MSKINYFNISPNSFEKNAGYKTTVHAINEIVDNAYEANASIVNILLQINNRKQLTAIHILDNGKGMDAELLQKAICEKSGTNMDRQTGAGKKSRAKYGKYGVGLPKASISQCNKFTVYSWTSRGPSTAYCNGIDITDLEWISDGAQVDDSIPKSPSKYILKLANAEEYESGTLVSWEKLDGITWTRARMGNKGLAPNLEFLAGRIYRKAIEKGDFNIRVITFNESWNIEEEFNIKPNDPLYVMEQAYIPRLDLGDSVWPEESPLFDQIPSEHIEFDMQLPDGTKKKVVVDIRISMAKKNVFAKYNGRAAGSLPHGQHAKNNVGISFLREGREVEMCTVLSNPSEPRERWIGVEVDFPHELDGLLGMTNNKQAYTRLNALLPEGIDEYKIETESRQDCIERLKIDDLNTANCIVLVEKIRAAYLDTLQDHKNMREDVVGKKSTLGDNDNAESELDSTPETEAENEGTRGDNREVPEIEDKEKEKQKYIQKLVEDGVPAAEAKSIAARIINKGLKYTVVRKTGLGLPFFNARKILNTYLLELNSDHDFFTHMSPFLDYTNEESDPKDLLKQLDHAKTAFFLMLEAWIKLEIEAENQEKHNMVSIRSDWGRMLSKFLHNKEGA